jgi:hypothetical protein
MATKNYRVKIVRGEVEFEAEGDKNFVLQMLGRFEQPGAAAQTVGGAGGNRTPE